MLKSSFSNPGASAIVALAKEVEKVRDTLYKAGQCSFSSLAEARMAVLEAEEALEKAKTQRTTKDAKDAKNTKDN
jgi:outer membrane protein TolC